MADEAKFILVGWSKANTDVLSDIQNIIAIPATSDTEALAEYYSMADAFVLPSLAENYATVSLESMACGTPVVGFDAGGIPEQLLENKGIVVPTGNQKAFTAAVREAISSENKLLRGEPLVEMIRNKNSTDKTVREYLTLYHELAQK